MSTSADRRKKVLIKSIGTPKGENLSRGAKIYYGSTKNGVKTALVVRKADHLYRGKCATLNEANSVGRLGWPMAISTLWSIQKRHECKYVLMFNSTNGDLWISRPADWDDADKLVDGDALHIDYRGTPTRYLSVEHMLKLDGAIDLKNSRR